MGAARGQHLSSATLAAVEGKVLTHDPQRYSTAWLEILRSVYGMPERPQISPGKGAWAAMADIRVIRLSVLMFG